MEQDILLHDNPPEHDSIPSSLVIVPTYNEAENIEALLKALLALHPKLHTLIVDDNSPDGTAALVKQQQEHSERIHLLQRPGKMGLGSAYVDGFKYALERDYELIFEMDADFSHCPAEILQMIEVIPRYDLVIGSRYVSGINVVNWPLHRLFLSYMASKYVWLITGLPVRDPTGGFKCFRRRVLEAIDLDNILSDGYSFQVEMNFRAWLHGFRIKEIPIVFTDRRSGKSKMSKKIIFEAVWMMWKLKLLQLTGRIPRKR
ncbi:MAG: polyprenol monophosphomannose synthase [Candidatus Cloacimonetes bacterium]|nr:polyprenol monophosphomannose synthase [Candidatus Cloacimonadota bacterium]